MGDYHFTFATCNVDKALTGSRLLRAVRFLRPRVETVTDITSWCEVEHSRFRDAINRIPGMVTFWPGGNRVTPRNFCPISYRGSMFTRVDGGCLQVGDGIARVQPNRWLTWVVLRHRASKRLVCVMSTHTVSGLYKRNHYAQWNGRTRLEESDRELDMVRAQTLKLCKRYPDAVVIGGADLNRVHRIPGDRLGLPTNYAAKPTHGRHWFDVLWGRNISGVHRVLTPSDHDVLVGVVRFKGGSRLPRGFMPGAVAKNIPPGANDPPITPIGVIFHVAVSRADSLHGFFEHDGGIESHFYVRFDGTIEQYRSIWFEADAQNDGNSFVRGGKRCGFVSVETAGMGSGTWTAAQVASLKQIVLWVKSQSDFPLRKCPAWNAPGVGYHCLFHRWNVNAHSCPGPDRVKQFDRVFVPWFRGAGAAPAKGKGSEDLSSLRVKMPKNYQSYAGLKSKDKTVSLATGLSMLWWQAANIAANLAAQRVRTKRIEAKVNELLDRK